MLCIIQLYNRISINMILILKNEILLENAKTCLLLIDFFLVKMI